MRVEELLDTVKQRRAALEQLIFERPPQSFEEFQKRLGNWVGLGEILAIADVIRKKESNED